MPKRLFKPPTNLIEQWPEVFEDMYMNTIPVFYMISVVLEFKDHSVWEIDIQTHLGHTDADQFSKKLLGVLEEYSPKIKKIDFKFDINKLKKDIRSSTKKLL